MKRSSALALVALLGPLTALGQQDEKLFNGKNLDGWDGDPRLWSVADGILVGETNGSDKKVGANTFLIWKGGELGDFDLKVVAKVSGENNSGIQYRAKVLDKAKWSVGGYQMDMHPKQEYLGMLYEERGRGIQCLRGEKVELTADGKKKVTGKLPLPNLDLATFNEFTISARGNVVKHFVNGKQAAEIVDNNPQKRAQKGILALQLHAGKPMKLEVKEITLRKVKAAPAKAPAKKPTAKAKGEVPSWIWSATGDRPNGEKVYFRKTFQLPAPDKAAALTITCDNGFQAWINGQKVGSGNAWENPQNIEVRKHVNKGTNTIAVLGTNSGGVAALCASLEITLGDGKKMQVVTDGSWKTSGKEAANWQSASFDDSSWGKAAVHGKMGMSPWGGLFGGGLAAAGGPQEARDTSDQYTVAKGFTLEKLYDVPKGEGSWVAMTVRDDGRLICSDQYGKLYNVTVSPSGTTSTERIEVPIGGAHGLLWFRNALWVSVNEGVGGDAGVYKLTDKDGDGKLEDKQFIMPANGRGEHGTHALVPSPDGKWIYFIAGNHTQLPQKIDRYRVPKVWKEDHLLPRQPDARGHARGKMAPGGYVCRFTPDGKNWELVSIGYRNPYDLAFNAAGDLFTYDADMEWDFGTPWYRPTRINHVVSGSEFGWRNGTGKWPDYYEDSLPASIDIGPGCPTGVLSGLGAKFPAKYQHAIYVLDWTYATLYAIHLTPDGASYTATKEDFVAGKGLPLTDAVIGKDGAMYFATGGRRTKSALWRVTYTGSESTAPVPTVSKGPAPDAPVGLRRRLEAMHVPNGGADLDLIAMCLGHDDRFVRYAARIALEHQPVEKWRGGLDKAKDPWRVVMLSIALSRHGGPTDRPAILSALGGLDWGGLDTQQRLGVLRSYALVFSRFGEPSEVARKAVLKHLDNHFPAKDDNLNRELCRVLCYLKSPTVVGKTLKLMASLEEPAIPEWAVLASRNDGYGGAVKKMLANLPSTQKLHYAYCLRTVPGPWTPGQRKQFFTWFSEAEKKSGGASYGGFIKNIRNDALASCTAEEKSAIEKMKLTVPTNPYQNLPPVKGPGKNWTKAEMVAMINSGLKDADRANGKKMYAATLCAACHRFDGEGGAAGPDLTGVSSRFQAADLADAILDPSKEVSDQYRFEIITRTDGSALTGRTIEVKDGVRTVAVSPFDFSDTTRIPQSEIRTIEESPFSPMPPGLVYRLNEEELRDLLGYLLKE